MALQVVYSFKNYVFTYQIVHFNWNVGRILINLVFFRSLITDVTFFLTGEMYLTGTHFLLLSLLFYRLKKTVEKNKPSLFRFFTRFSSSAKKKSKPPEKEILSFLSFVLPYHWRVPNLLRLQICLKF